MPAPTNSAVRPRLIDGQGRQIVNLRVSVTDRCNFRCTYCMPADNVQFMPRDELLTYEEIARIVRVAAALGISRIRFTGGEPLMRKDVTDLVRMIGAIDGIDDLALTTNAFFLDKLAVPLREAGLQRLNISLDALDREKVAQVARRDCIDQVLRGIEAASQAWYESIKINAVAMRDFSEDQILKMIEFARDGNFEIRFIEYMPLDADRAWERAKVLLGSEIVEIIRERYELIPIGDSRERGPATEFRFPDGRGRLGLITAVSQPFCDSCNRIRMTADGKLRTCLFSERETDLKSLVRGGAEDSVIADTIRAAVAKKEPGHKINHPDFVQPERAMHAIGG